MVAFWVATEERDNAIRISVGSSPRRELGRTLRRVAGMAVPGLALSLAAAAVIVRTVSQVGALHGGASVTVLLLSLCAVTLAAIVPGRRLLAHTPAHLLRRD